MATSDAGARTIRDGAKVKELERSQMRCLLHAPIQRPTTDATMPHSSIELVNEYIKRFGEAVGVELHPLDADGYTDVRHGAVVIGINAYVKRNVLLILARLGKASCPPTAEMYRRLLELNFLATRRAAALPSMSELSAFTCEPCGRSMRSTTKSS